MRLWLCWGMLVCGALGAGCGSNNDKDPLAKFAGWYDVTEAFANQVGVQCPPEPTQIVENTVEVRVDGNEFEARFTDRWDVLKGEIREDATFLSVGNLGPDASLRFTGHFEETTLIGSLDDVKGAGCTRTFSVNGLLRGAE